MSSLFDKNGVELTKPTEIRKEVFEFYKKLYSSNEANINNVDLNELLNDDTKKLSDLEASSIEGSITFKEAGASLQKIQNCKSPGSSGYTAEFFKFFWKDLGHIIVQAINFGFFKGELSTTQREGIITCIPKGNKSKKFIKNWRPISLLNTVYKIASGCIASRIKEVLPSIIDYDQAGFMSGRFTGDNIRLIYDILNHSKLQDQNGILLLIDFEKAFDSVAWSFMEKCLIYFNFKDDIIKWVKTFYNKISSSIIVNNRPTQWFPIERGCRQGDPISPYIFLICSEVLANMIRQNKEIIGYKIFDNEIKISQYADDTSLFLDGSKKSFEVCVETVLEYAKYSGLAMNFEKTKVICFGGENNDVTYMPHLNLEWNPKSFSILGIDFTKDLENITDINIEKKLVEMQKEINAWSKRDLTPFGRVTVIKSLIISKIVHILIALPTPSFKLMKKINKMLYDFLWDNKPDKIKRYTTKLSLEKGGIGMIDLESFDKSLKLTWIRRLINSNSTWKSLIFNIYPELQFISHYGDKFIDNLCNLINNPFWKNVFSYYLEFYSKFKILSTEDLKATCFQLNNKFKIANSTINNAELKRNNIFFVHQLMDDDNKFLSHESFIQKFNIQINYITYYSIVTCVRSSIDYENLEEDTPTLKFQPPLNIILKQKKGASEIYKIFIDFSTDCKGKEKSILLTGIKGEEWLTSFTILKFSTNDTKLRWLQFRILHLILTTNRSVAKFKENQTDLCTFCNHKSETILHLFWECSIVKVFWDKLLFLLKKRCLHADRLVFNERLILYGHSEFIYTDKILDKIILLAKMYIYRNKVQGQNLNIKTFLSYVYDRYCIEKLQGKDSNVIEVLWYPYKGLFQSLF